MSAPRVLSALLLLLLAQAACAPAPPRWNLLLVVVDTLRADHLSCYGYARETSPQLDSLAAQGLAFDAVQSPRAKTTPAVATLMTGLYPHDHGVRDLTRPLPDDTPTLAEGLAAAGYRTAAVVGNFVLQRRLSGLDRGFGTWIEHLPERSGVPPDGVPERRARSLTDGALELLFDEETGLVRGAEPWLLYLHYMDPHGLYEPPQEQRIFRAAEPRPIEDRDDGRPLRVATYNVPAEAWTPDGRIDAAPVVDAYDGEVRHVDEQLGRLFEALEESGALEHTWVVVTADHGESLGEHDYWFEHGLYAYQATCHVPLLVRPPDALHGAPRGERRATTLSLADLAPTLCAWLGLDAPVRTPRGRGPVGRALPGLLTEDSGRTRAAFGEKVESRGEERAVRTKTVRMGRYKLVQRYVPSPQGTRIEEELYDLAADPHEERDLSQERPAGDPLLAGLRAELEGFLAADPGFEDLAARLAEERESLGRRDPAVLRTLEAMGY